jgi:hypothetical protein
MKRKEKTMKNFILISPNFPDSYWKFCAELKNNGLRVLGIGDCPYDELRQELRCVEQDYDNLIMEYEDLNRDYEKEVNEVVQLQLLVTELKSEIYDLQNELAAAKYTKADTKVVS